MHCSRRLIVQTLVFSRSYLHRQVSPPETLVVNGGTTWARNGRWIFRDLLHAINLRHGTNGFTSFPKEGVLRIFFALKNPTASAGFEPANLGTKGQHTTTSRPPKPLSLSCTGEKNGLGLEWRSISPVYRPQESLWFGYGEVMSHIIIDLDTTTKEGMVMQSVINYLSINSLASFIFLMICNEWRTLQPVFHSFASRQAIKICKVTRTDWLKRHIALWSLSVALTF